MTDPSTLLVAVALIAYNNLANLWPPFNGAAYVPLNVAATFLLGLLAYGPLGLGSTELGTAGIDATDLGLGLVFGALATLPLFGLTAFERGRRLIADRRVKGLAGAALAYQVVIRIPIGTALFEEAAFRGVLYGSWVDSGALPAALASSLAFGLWHISPTLNLIRANRPSAPTRVLVATVVGAILVTAAAGALLVWLREATGSLAAPVAFHAATNSLATLAAVRANRLQAVQSTPETPSARANSSASSFGERP